MEEFPDTDACYDFLAQQKWADGYECIKCGCNTYCRGVKPYSRRCIRCRYDESPTANTIFHKLKFDVHLAFQMAHEIATSKKGSSCISLAERYGIQQKTAWLFRQKVQEAMVSIGKYPLLDVVHVDDF